jgi:hypothetical protein
MPKRLIKNTFETLEKVVKKTTAAVASDIHEQVTGEFKELLAEEKSKIQAEETAKLQAIRKNLTREMQVKKPTIAQPEIQKKQQEAQQKQIKELQTKQKKDSALQRMINAAKGTKEKYSGNIQ